MSEGPRSRSSADLRSTLQATSSLRNAGWLRKVPDEDLVWRSPCAVQLAEREFQRWLTQDAGLTRSQARAVIRHGLKGLTTQDAARGHPPPLSSRIFADATSGRHSNPTRTPHANHPPPRNQIHRRPRLRLRRLHARLRGLQGRQRRAPRPARAPPVGRRRHHRPRRRIDRALDETKRVVDDLALKSARPHLGGPGVALRRRPPAQGRLRRLRPQGRSRAPARSGIQGPLRRLRSRRRLPRARRARARRQPRRAQRLADPRHCRHPPGLGLGLQEALRHHRRRIGLGGRDRRAPRDRHADLGRALLPDHGALRHAGRHLGAARRLRPSTSTSGSPRRCATPSPSRKAPPSSPATAPPSPRASSTTPRSTTPPGAGATSASSRPARTAPLPPPTPATS